MSLRHTSRSRRRILADACRCEPLESRRLLTAVFDGTGGNDTIIIGINGSITHVVINGIQTTTGDLSIVINALGGNDSVQVVGTRVGSDITVNAGSGNDTLDNIGADIDVTFRGNFHFNGDDDFDHVDADNSNDATTAATITIQPNGIVKDTNFLFQYDAVEDIDFIDSNGSNRIEFINMQNGVEPEVANLTINGNGGNDLIVNHRTVTAAGHLPTSLATGAMSFTGGGGSDTLVLDDALNGFGASFIITSSTIDYDSAFATTGLVTYDNFESFNIVGTNAGDLVTINSKVSGNSMMIETIDGNDTVTIGGGAIRSNGFAVANTTIFAGSGTDSIRFDDHLSTAGELYTFNNFTLAAGSGGLTYGGFETQTLDLADGAVPAEFDPTNNLNINAISGQISSTTINGGPNHVQLVNVGNGNLANVAGTLALNLSYRAVNALNINDQNATGTTSSYEVNNIQVRKTSTGQTINYSGVGQMTLNARDSATILDVIDVKSTPAGMSLTVNANAGNDNIFFGNGNVDVNVLGPITLNAGAGTDFLGINNSLDTSVESMTLNAASFIDNGITYAFTGVEGTLTVNLGNGPTDLTINGTPSNTNVNGGSGNDTFTVGGGDIDANFPTTVGKGLFIQAGGGINSMRLNDVNDTNVDLYVFQQAQGLDQFVKRDGANENFITWSGMSSVTLDASNAPAAGASISTILVNSIGTPLRINGNGGPDAVQVADSFSPVTVHTGLGDTDNLSVNSDLDAIAATVVIDQSDDIENLSIFSGGTLRVTSGAVVTKTRLGLNPSLTINGVLDLAGGALLSRAGGPTPAQFRTQIIAGRNGGAWNGTNPAGAINSSLAASTPISDGVGYGLGSEIAPTTIGSFNIAAGDTLLRYTLDGDADLSGAVNLADFNRLAANFGQTNKAWVDGDSTYDGLVNLADFNALAGNFGQAVGAPDLFGGKPIHGINDSDDRREILEQLT